VSSALPNCPEQTLLMQEKHRKKVSESVYIHTEISVMTLMAIVFQSCQTIERRDLNLMTMDDLELELDDNDFYQMRQLSSFCENELFVHGSPSAADGHTSPQIDQYSPLSFTPEGLVFDFPNSTPSASHHPATWSDAVAADAVTMTTTSLPDSAPAKSRRGRKRLPETVCLYAIYDSKK